MRSSHILDNLLVTLLPVSTRLSPNDYITLSHLLQRLLSELAIQIATN